MHRSQYGEEYQQTGEAMKRFSVAIMLLFASTAFAVDIAAIRAKAEAGNLAAMTTMGSLYHHGHGVAQDDAQALQWYLLAALWPCWCADYYRDDAFAERRRGRRKVLVAPCRGAGGCHRTTATGPVEKVIAMSPIFQWVIPS